MYNEVFMGMYRTAVASGRLPIEFVPEPYRTALREETENNKDETATE